jgi:hypothetical protein
MNLVLLFAGKAIPLCQQDQGGLASLVFWPVFNEFL